MEALIGCVAAIAFLLFIFGIRFGVCCLFAIPIIWAANGLFEAHWVADWYHIWRVGAVLFILSLFFGGGGSSSD